MTHPLQISALRVSACNLRKMQEDTERQVHKEHVEWLASISSVLESPNARHIRHQRQHLGENFDPRNRMVDKKIVFTNAELKNLNVSRVNR